MIRPGRAADCKYIAGIFNALLAAGALTDTENMVSTADRESWLAAHKGSYPVYVWETDGQVVGWSSLSPFSPRPEDSRLAEIGVYVSHDWQGRGIGGSLITQVLDGIDAGINTIFAIVFARNDKSQALFEKRGFERAVCLYEPAILRGKWEDVLWYNKPVGVRNIGQDHD
jgi:phosphinothricin acetyltransferase